jgi:8-oxo-dGTP diphosphatase
MAPVVAVGALVIDDGRLLMVKRDREPGKGLWTVPGGRVEHGEYLDQALRREVKEETGLEIEVGGLAGIFEVVGDDHFVIHDHAAHLTHGDQEVVVGDEVAEVRWVPLEEIEGLECTPRFVETLKAWEIL